MSPTRAYLLLLWLLLPVLGAQGQNNQVPLVTAQFDAAPLEQVVQELEKQTGYRFFYDSLTFTDLRISLTARGQPLRAVLDQAFRNSPFTFALDHQRHVFLLSGQELQTELPPGLFAPGQANPQGPERPVAQAEPGFAPREQRTGLAAGQENKLLEIGRKTNSLKAGTATLTGYVRNARTGDPVAGAAVYLQNPSLGTTTNEAGFYILTLSTGRHTLYLRSTGLRSSSRQIKLYTDGQLNLELQDQTQALKEVVVVGEQASNVNRVQMGVEKLDIRTIKQIPTVFGEADVLRAVLTLPGVKTVGEATTGFNVRGGSTDQNLILFNDATIYNPSHFFGFLSAFNAEVIKDVELYKSSIPVQYGGRLSSVLEINSREGNMQEFQGSAGLGLITSRLTLEGPLAKDKTSFLIGGRTTYSDWVFGILPEQSGLKNTEASFYDLNLHLTHQANPRNKLNLTGYLSRDASNLNTDTLYRYGNTNLALNWQREFDEKLFGVLSAGHDRYQYDASSDQNPVNAFVMDFNLHQTHAKADFTYTLHAKHTLTAGASTLYYALAPSSYQPLGQESLVVPLRLQAEQALESALYVSERFDPTPELSLSAGLRYSLFQYLGPQQVRRYSTGLPLEEENKLETEFHDRGRLIKNYHGPEWRLSGRYRLSDNASVKMGFNTMRQYIHQISNTTAIAPTDIYKLSDPNIRPQLGNQISLGLYRNFRANTLETSVEVYYKRLRDYLDYKSGALLVLNPHLETDVLATVGKAYGAEFMLKKPAGQLNGWVSYTYSRTLLRANDPTAGEIINNGNYYAANFDKPHDFSLISNYRFSRRLSVSGSVAYSTGRPITVPIGGFYYAGSYRTLYGDRNSYRIPDYFRTDMSVNIEGNHRLKQLTHNSWTVGVYNLTSRRNPYSVYFTSQRGVITGYKLSIFGSAIPFVNYNIRF